MTWTYHVQIHVTALKVGGQLPIFSKSEHMNPFHSMVLFPGSHKLTKLIEQIEKEVKNLP